jgi:hypothetical protein
VDIGGYFRLNYHRLLVVINGYYIIGYRWLLMVIMAILLMAISDYYIGGHKHTKPPKNCNHKYNLSAINFFCNVWTSHPKLFLFVLSVFD